MENSQRKAKIELHCGDCLEVMKEIPDKSVDMIFADLPYGTTHNFWDTRIPLEPLWGEYRRILKPGGVTLLFAQNPFAAELIQSNRKEFRYEWIWEKTMATGFLNANRMPLRAHELILVFYRKLPKYNPQKIMDGERVKNSSSPCQNYGKYRIYNTYRHYNGHFPRDVIKFRNSRQKEKTHPTEKPIDLLEYMIRTYTNEGETVMDNCMGTGSCGVACRNLSRGFIGIEKDRGYFEIATKRIFKWQAGT